jgi:hypothetical protein
VQPGQTLFSVVPVSTCCGQFQGNSVSSPSENNAVNCEKRIVSY